MTAADEQGHFVLKYPIILIDDINMEQVQEVVTRRILHNTGINKSFRRNNISNIFEHNGSMNYLSAWSWQCKS